VAETPKAKASIEGSKATQSRVSQTPKQKGKAKTKGLEEPEVSGRPTSAYMDWYLSQDWVICDRCKARGIHCKYIGKSSCGLCTSQKKQCERDGQRLKPKVPRKVHRPVLKSKEVFEVSEEEEKEEKEMISKMAQSKAAKVQPVRQAEVARSTNLSNLQDSVTRGFETMEVKGLEEFYSGQVSGDRSNITKDTVSMARVLQTWMNYGFERFYQEAGVELKDLRNPSTWRTKVVDNSVDVPTGSKTGDQPSGSFSSVPFTVNQPI
jgi:hypothetical protein